MATSGVSAAQYSGTSYFYPDKVKQGTDAQLLHKLYNKYVRSAVGCSEEDRKQLSLYTQNCFNAFDASFIEGKNALYQHHVVQRENLLQLMYNPLIDRDFKLLAIRLLPTSSKSAAFSYEGVAKSLTILNCGSIEKARLLVRAWQLTEDIGRQHFDQIMGVQHDDSCGSLSEWDVVPSPANSEKYLQDRYCPLYAAKLYAADLFTRLGKAENENAEILLNELKLAIGVTEYEKLMKQIKEKYRGDLDKKSVCRLVIIELEFMDLTLLSARNLFPMVPFDFEFGTRNTHARKTNICRLTEDHRVVIFTPSGQKRQANVSDLRDINLSELHPHVRNQLVSIAFENISDKGDLVEFMFENGLVDQTIDESEYYKYDFRRRCLKLLQIGRAEQAGTLGRWMTSPETDDDKVKRIYPCLRIKEDRLAYFKRARESGFRLHYSVESLDADEVNILGAEYIKTHCSEKVIQTTLERLCNVQPTKEEISVFMQEGDLSASAKEAIENYKQALKTVMLSLKTDVPQCYTTALFLAITTENITALELMYEHVENLNSIRVNHVPPEMYAAGKGHLQPLIVILGHVKSDLVHYKRCEPGLLFLQAARLDDPGCLDYLLSQERARLSELVAGANSQFLDKLASHASPSAIAILLRAEPFNQPDSDDNSALSAWKSRVSKDAEVKADQPVNVACSMYRGYSEMQKRHLKILTRNQRVECLLHFIKKGETDNIKQLLDIHKAETVFADALSSCEKLIDSLQARGGQAVEMLKILEGLGFNTTTEDCRVIAHACNKGATSIVKHLVQRYCEQDTVEVFNYYRSFSGRNLMHIVAEQNNPELMKELHKVCPDLIHMLRKLPKAGDTYLERLEQTAPEQAQARRERLRDTPLLSFVKSVQASEMNIEALMFLLKNTGTRVFYPTDTKVTKDDAFLTVVKGNNLKAAAVFVQHYNGMPSTNAKETSKSKVMKFVTENASEEKYQPMIQALKDLK